MLQLEKKKSNRTYEEIDQLHLERVKKVRQSNIDFTKYGWTVRVSKLIDLSSQKVRIWMKAWCPDLLENAYTRNV